MRGPVSKGIGPRPANAGHMDRPVDAARQPPRGIALRPDKLVRVFLVFCIGLSLWLAFSPLQDYLHAQDRATETRTQLRSLEAEQVRLQAQNRDLSRGTGLEEQARRQGLIDPSEKSYVIEGLR